MRMSTRSPHHMDFVIDILRDRIDRLEAKVEALMDTMRTTYSRPLMPESEWESFAAQQLTRLDAATKTEKPEREGCSFGSGAWMNPSPTPPTSEPVRWGLQHADGRWWPSNNSIASWQTQSEADRFRNTVPGYDILWTASPIPPPDATAAAKPATEKVRVVQMATGDFAYWIVRRADGRCYHPRVTDRHDPWRMDGFGMELDIAEAVAAAINAREAR